MGSVNLEDIWKQGRGGCPICRIVKAQRMELARHIVENHPEVWQELKKDLVLVIFDSTWETPVNVELPRTKIVWLLRVASDRIYGLEFGKYYEFSEDIYGKEVYRVSEEEAWSIFKDVENVKDVLTNVFDYRVEANPSEIPRFPDGGKDYYYHEYPSTHVIEAKVWSISDNFILIRILGREEEWVAMRAENSHYRLLDKEKVDAIKKEVEDAKQRLVSVISSVRSRGEMPEAVARAYARITLKAVQG